jgi:formylglycine-generating enzyme required for sulfatase activity
MSATFTCPNCGHSGRSKKEIPTGARVRCPQCQSVFKYVPYTSGDASESAIENFLGPTTRSSAPNVIFRNEEDEGIGVIVAALAGSKEEDARLTETPPLLPASTAALPETSRLGRGTSLTHTMVAGFFFCMGVLTTLVCVLIYSNMRGRTKNQSRPTETIATVEEAPIRRQPKDQMEHVDAPNRVRPPDAIPSVRLSIKDDEAIVKDNVNPPKRLYPPEKNEPVKFDHANSIGMKFVRIPQDGFSMGSTSRDFHADKDELPQHDVAIARSFLLGVYEVTQEEYREIMGVSPSWFSSTGAGSEIIADCVKDRGLRSENTSNHPVENITWSQATEFCQKLGAKESRVYRLPTEAEWEYACRAGTATHFSFGEDLNRLKQYAWTKSMTVPVGRLSPNEFGLYDMYGNVFELCQDWYNRNYYENTPLIDPHGPKDGLLKVMRGGSFATYGNGSVNERMGYRSAKRWSVAPNRVANDIGFRILLEKDGKS